MQQGDVLLFQTNDDGNIIVENGIVEMSGGLETAAYLSLFGGNEDCNGLAACPFSWWGNSNENDESKKQISETQFLVESLPAASNNLRRVEDAALRDLSWFIRDNIASSVSVVASIPMVNLVKLVVKINAEGLESTFEFVENWKAAT